MFLLWQNIWIAATGYYMYVYIIVNCAISNDSYAPINKFTAS